MDMRKQESIAGPAAPGADAALAQVIDLAGRRPGRAATRARLESVFREHQPNVLRFLAIRLGSMADAHDCFQIVCTRLLERSGELADHNLAALLYVCARNVAIDELRRRRNDCEHDGTAAEGERVADGSPLPDRYAQAEQQLELLWSLLDELPPKCRRAFINYKLDGMEYRDIAASMGITESMVRKYVIKAVAHCAARFEQLDGWE